MYVKTQTDERIEIGEAVAKLCDSLSHECDECPIVTKAPRRESFPPCIMAPIASLCENEADYADPILRRTGWKKVE